MGIRGEVDDGQLLQLMWACVVTKVWSHSRWRFHPLWGVSLCLILLPGCRAIQESDLPTFGAEDGSPSEPLGTPVGDDDSPGDDDDPGDDDTSPSTDTPVGDDDTEGEGSPSPPPTPTPPPTEAPDDDQDGFQADIDCDDGDPAVFPGAEELCDGLDNDCDGEVDEGVASIFYADEDGDGFGDASNPIPRCDTPTDLISLGLDCDDDNSKKHPMMVAADAAGETDPDGTAAAPLPTIQEAIDSKKNCGMVFIAAGEYRESLSITDQQNLSVEGTAGSAETRVLGSAGARALLVQHGTNLTLRGLSFTTIDPVAGHGGAVGVFDSTTVLLEDVVIHDAETTGEGADGGGVAFVRSQSVTVRDSELRANEGDTGGGLVSLSSNVIVTGSLIQANVARNGGGGLAVAALDGEGDGALRIELSQIVDNESSGRSGGGARADENQTLVLEDTVFYRNHTHDLYAGAAYSPSYVTHCTFIENEADSYNGYGGALELRSSSVIRNSIFMGNFANTGGAINVWDYVGSIGEHLIENNTFMDDWTTSGNGSSIYLFGARSATVRNNIMVDTGLHYSNVSVYTLDVNELSIDHNNVEYASGIAFNLLSTTDVGEDGNLSVASDFVQYESGLFYEADLQLLASSQCIDVGNPDVGTDPDGSAPDMGAYGGPYGGW